MRERTIPTAHGPAQVVTHAARGRRRASVLLTHGAGGGVDAIDLVALSSSLPRHGFDVHLLEMPWRVAGKKVASRPAVLDECFEAVWTELALKGTTVIGGRSAGARVCCRLAAALGADGVLALAFPLHPPGRPESSRLDELASVSCPVLVVQGEKDAFGGPSEFPDDVPLIPVPFADHSLKVPKRATTSQEAALEAIVGSVLHWLQDSIL